MALRKKAVEPAAPPKRRALVASAMRFQFGGNQTWKGGMPAGDRGWQSRAWYHFDICGELFYGTSWKANAAAQALLYAAEVDPATGKAAKPASDPTVVAIAETCLGGPAKRPQHVNTMALNLEIAGEAWAMVRPPTEEQLRENPDAGDEWFVLSTTELIMSNGRVEFLHPDTGAKTPFGERDGDTLIRLYRKHPNRQHAPNSAVRSLLPTLDEIENSSKEIAARLDSRLIGAGMMTVPEEADLPVDDSDPNSPTLLTLLAEAATKSLSDPGTASSQVPIMVPVPAEFADAFRHITFETPMSKETLTLRAEAIGRLAAGLDLPREIIEGMGDSNHWSAWQVQESTYTTHLLPLLDLISDALTTAWFTHALRAAGVTDPERFILAFDGTSLIGQPDETEQTLELFDRGLITADATRQKLNVPEEYAPQGEAEQRAFVTRLVIAAPTLISDPEIRRILGFNTAAPAPAVEAAQPAAIETADTASTGQAPPSRTASIGEASLLVVFALERAGNRLLNTQRMKAQFAHVARHELHTKLRPDPERHGDILDDAWRHNPRLAADLRLDDYTRRLIADGIPHTDDLLRGWVASLDRP